VRIGAAAIVIGSVAGISPCERAPTDAATSHALAAPAPAPSPTQAATHASSPAFAPALAPMPLVSLGVPAFASDAFEGSSPSLANDADYSIGWRSAGIPWVKEPAWLVYDLSAIPEAHRRRVVVEWFHAHGYAPYDTAGVMAVTYDLPRDYQLQIHDGPGGGAPPDADDPGWKTIATVTMNRLVSRQHVVRLDPDGAPHAWLRLRCTSPLGAIGRQHLAIGMDVYDASAGTDDDWIFFGDSITQMSINELRPVVCAPPLPCAYDAYGEGTIGQRIHAAKPAYFPLVEGAGVGGFNSRQGLALVTKNLPGFPGRFVALSFGTNDAVRCTGDCPRRFYANMEAMVQRVIAAGKVPVVPKIPYAWSKDFRDGIPPLNAQIDALYAAYPAIVRGPDLYALFAKRPSLLAMDGLHPTELGSAALRDAWVKAILAAGIYP
jgi:lysophospholipase L1-like esterase